MSLQLLTPHEAPTTTARAKGTPRRRLPDFGYLISQQTEEAIAHGAPVNPQRLQGYQCLAPNALADLLQQLCSWTISTGSAWDVDVEPFPKRLAIPDPLFNAQALLRNVSFPPGVELKDAESAKNLAQAALQRLAEAGLAPSRVITNADAEVAFYFFGQALLPDGAHRRVARLAFSVDGATLTMEDREAESHIVEIEGDEPALDQAFAQIQGFLA